MLGPNIRFFVAHNVKGIFEEDTDDTPTASLPRWADTSWPSACGTRTTTRTGRSTSSSTAYYGKAAAPIRAYIDLLHDHVEQENIHVNIWAATDSPHLTDELLTKADELWQQAESLVAGEPEVLERVKRSRMSVDYAILERARLQAQKKLPADEAFARLAAASLPAVLCGASAEHAHATERRTTVGQAGIRPATWPRTWG